MVSNVVVSQRILPVRPTGEEMVADPAGAHSAGIGRGVDLRVELGDRLAHLSFHVTSCPEPAMFGVHPLGCRRGLLTHPKGWTPNP